MNFFFNVGVVVSVAQRCCCSLIVNSLKTVPHLLPNDKNKMKLLANTARDFAVKKTQHPRKHTSSLIVLSKICCFYRSLEWKRSEEDGKQKQKIELIVSTKVQAINLILQIWKMLPA
jgi:hypothetical protein